MAEQAQSPTPADPAPTPAVTPLPEGQDQPGQQQQAHLTARAAELANEVATTAGPARNAAEAELESVADRAQAGPDTSRAAYADSLRDAGRAELDDDDASGAQVEDRIRRDQQNARQVGSSPANGEALAAELAAPGPDARLQLKWQQINDEVLPFEALRLYLEGQGLRIVRDAPGYRVARGEGNKLTADFQLQYDPEQADPLKIEGAIQGLKELGKGNSLRVIENPEQEATRQQRIDPGRVSDIRLVANELKRELAVATWGTDPAPLVSLIPKAELTSPAPPVSPAEPAPAVAPAPTEVGKAGAPEQAPAAVRESGVGELQIKWRQQGDAVAPLLEMRAYLDELNDLGIAVGPMKFEKGADGKLSGSFGVSYDPASPALIRLEGITQGLKRVGNGVEVIEMPEQVVARRQILGVDGQDQATDLGYSVKEAFGVKQWDVLSAQLSVVPKQALTGPEQAQQAAGTERVQQVARQQGKTNEQIIRDGKSVLDIDTSGNPVSAFLKNFYQHLNGAPRTRQTLEVDYEKTRQELQARLVRLAGNTAFSPPVAVAPGPQVTSGGISQLPGTGSAPLAPEVATAAVTAPAPLPAAPVPAPKFTEADIPQKVLATLGLTIADLASQGQLQKLLNGDKTDLLAMQAAGQEGQEAVTFEAKMVLHREANGSATLKMELPKKQLEIPNEIGGQPFTPEQRQRLASEGTAGLVRGLKDKDGNPYNGYVGVDREMNKLVVLPENKVAFKDEIAGVKLSPEQSHDLREGKAVHLVQMNRPDGGAPFDGTAQIHAAKAGVEVKPEPYELARKQAPAAIQTRDRDSEKMETPVVPMTEEAAPKPRVRGPRM